MRLFDLYAASYALANRYTLMKLILPSLRLTESETVSLSHFDYITKFQLDGLFSKLVA